MRSVNVDSLKKLSARDMSSNAQRVARKLLLAQGEWVSRKVLVATLAASPTSVTASVRDLRKPNYGGFRVEAASAADLGKRGTRQDFYYRIPASTVTKSAISTVFSSI